MVTKKVAHFVELNYHQDEIQVYILDRKGVMLANKKLPNDTAILDPFVRRHCTHFQASIEACTGAAAIGDELRHQYQWDIRQAHAGYVSRMKQSPDKTDYSDARILADLVRVDYLPEVWLPPVWQQTKSVLARALSRRGREASPQSSTYWGCGWLVRHGLASPNRVGMVGGM